MQGRDIGEIYEGIPVWNNGKWEEVSFKSRKEFKETLENDYFKEPGEYDLDDIVLEFQKEGLKYKKHNYFCPDISGTLDFIKYWDFEKLKSRKGVFFWKGKKKFFLPRDYYFWINFLPIQDKVKKKLDFPNVQDSQIHMALYECIAELNYEHGVILKKRQFGSSLYHAARLINKLWFEESCVLKIGASLSTYVTGTNGTWKMLNTYRNFLNENTAWYRPFNPGGLGAWQQKIEINQNGRKTEKGLLGTLESLTFEKDPATGVGGLLTEMLYEEAGIAPTMDITYGFMRPALQYGEIVTGFFVASGSVGDLQQCKPLKKFMYAPTQNGFYAVKNKFMNEEGHPGVTGLFIPEQWSMPPYVDQWGNSDVQSALDSIKNKRAQAVKTMDPNDYQLLISQHPTNLQEAFAFKEESIFPVALIQGLRRDIKEGAFDYRTYKLEYDANNDVIATPTRKLPILEFPLKKNSEDKTGSLVVWEEPVPYKRFGVTYFASVDPVAVGKSSTSESLCSIHVYRNAEEITRRLSNGDVETVVEGDKLVAAWCGRYDDINKTHEMLCKIIEWYNAWTLVECNVSLFIQYMQHNKKHKYLVPSDQFVFNKDAKASSKQFQTYGWRNVSTVFKNSILPHLIEYMKEDLWEDEEENKMVKGITRIPDEMFLWEAEEYTPDLNVDRIVSLAALIAFVKIQEANRGLQRNTTEEDYGDLAKSDKITKLDRSPFRNIGRNSSSLGGMVKPRSAFKNLR